MSYPCAATPSGHAQRHADARCSANITPPIEAGESGDEIARGGATPSVRPPYDSMRDCFLSYEFWREWKGMQLLRARIIALLKARAGQ